ncbi:hypothetical protein PsorP6_004194 [Peronosclerospora sorghi]|uniref:Uncharacterized protein n=1 Tax=Peronosclerospora sorghi TaxID=230839 RepID=A0ACC0VKA2_9STRA|nr:hypothetical protein PsorP6_004194 [Peronosclerospora sorghi]
MLRQHTPAYTPCSWSCRSGYKILLRFLCSVLVQVLGQHRGYQFRLKIRPHCGDYVFSDITSDFKHVVTISALWKLLRENECLVIAYSGSLWGSHHVRSARQFLLDSVTGDESTCVLLHHVRINFRYCLVAGSTWCHFVQRAPVVNRPRMATSKRWHDL